MSEDKDKGAPIVEIPVTNPLSVRVTEGSIEVDVVVPVSTGFDGMTFRLVFPPEQALSLHRIFQEIDARTGMLSSASTKPRTVQ